MYETKEVCELAKNAQDLTYSYYDDLSESYTKLNYILNDKSLTDKFMKLLKSVDEISDLINLAQMACCTDAEMRLIYEKIHNNALQDTFDKKYKQLQTLINNFTNNEDIYREALLQVSLYENV